jgi:phage-related holin
MEETTMRNFSIDLIWAKIQIAITAIGGWLGYFLGGIDGLMIALMIFMALDYVTGVMCAIIERSCLQLLVSRGLQEGAHPVMVGIANIVDLHVIGSGSALRGAVIAFTCPRGTQPVGNAATSACLSGQAEGRSGTACTNGMRRKARRQGDGE